MASTQTSHSDTILNEKDVKELSEKLSQVFCSFVNTKIGDNSVLKKYIDNYKALLHLPVFSEMKKEIESLKAYITALEADTESTDENIKLEVMTEENEEEEEVEEVEEVGILGIHI